MNMFKYACICSLLVVSSFVSLPIMACEECMHWMIYEKNSALDSMEQASSIHIKWLEAYIQAMDRSIEIYNRFHVDNQ